MAYTLCFASAPFSSPGLSHLDGSRVTSLAIFQGQVRSVTTITIKSHFDVCIEGRKKHAKSWRTTTATATSMCPVDSSSKLCDLHTPSSNHPLVEYEFEEIRTAIARDKDAANVGWLTLVKTPGNRRRLRIMIAIAFFSQWSGNNLM